MLCAGTGQGPVSPLLPQGDHSQASAFWVSLPQIGARVLVSHQRGAALAPAAPGIRSLGAPHVPVPSPACRLSSEGFILTPGHATFAKGWSQDGDLGGPHAAQTLSSNPSWPHPHPARWIPGPGRGAGCCARCMVPQGSQPPGEGVCEGKRGRGPALFARGRQTPVTQPAAAFLPAPGTAPPGPCAGCRGMPSTGHGDVPAPGAGPDAVTLQGSSRRSSWGALGAAS